MQKKERKCVMSRRETSCYVGYMHRDAAFFANNTNLQHWTTNQKQVVEGVNGVYPVTNKDEERWQSVRERDKESYSSLN